MVDTYKSIKLLTNQAPAAAAFLDVDFANLPEAMVMLIKSKKIITYTFSIFSIIVRILPLAERLRLGGSEGMALQKIFRL